MSLPIWHTSQNGITYSFSLPKNPQIEIRLYDLKQKEVINIKDCARLGYVGDLEFDEKTGCITALVVPGHKDGSLSAPFPSLIYKYILEKEKKNPIPTI